MVDIIFVDCEHGSVCIYNTLIYKKLTISREETLESCTSSCHWIYRGPDIPRLLIIWICLLSICCEGWTWTCITFFCYYITSLIIFPCIKKLLKLSFWLFHQKTYLYFGYIVGFTLIHFEIEVLSSLIIQPIKLN